MDARAIPWGLEKRIFTVRGCRVMLSTDLAVLYGVPGKVLMQSVRRNEGRFPPDFVFRLSLQEFHALRSQIVTSKRGGVRRALPYAFTEQGVAMLSGVLRSERAVQANVEIMRAFVRLRRMMIEHADLARRLDRLERKYDRRFRIVFDAIRRLMAPAAPSRRKIGFRTDT